MAFPLYDKLKELSIQNKDPLDIDKICTTISNIGQTLSPAEAAKHYRTIAALILHHNYLQTQEVVAVPYEGKVMVGGKGILYQFNNLPIPLQQIIGNYVLISST